MFGYKRTNTNELISKVIIETHLCVVVITSEGRKEIGSVQRKIGLDRVVNGRVRQLGDRSPEDRSKTDWTGDR